jgi:hypothetical protein
MPWMSDYVTYLFSILQAPEMGEKGMKNSNFIKPQSFF